MGFFLLAPLADPAPALPEDGEESPLKPRGLFLGEVLAERARLEELAPRRRDVGALAHEVVVDRAP